MLLAPGCSLDLAHALAKTFRDDQREELGRVIGVFLWPHHPQGWCTIENSHRILQHFFIFKYRYKLRHLQSTNHQRTLLVLRGEVLPRQDSGRTNGRTAGLSCGYKGSYCKDGERQGKNPTTGE